MGAHEYATDLGAPLSTLSRLVYLDLSALALGTDGVAAMAPHLAALTSLRSLALMDSGLVGGAGGAAVARATCTLSRLTHLALRRNRGLRDEGAAAVIRGLAPLDMLHCCALPLTVVRLSDALAALGGLTYLAIESEMNSWGADGAEAVHGATGHTSLPR